MAVDGEFTKQLIDLINSPSLAAARILESSLVRAKAGSRLLGRLNQKSSVDAATDSDRGVTERVANAFDASLTAAKQIVGITSSDPEFRPRIAAQRLLNPDSDKCQWFAQDSRIAVGKPVVEFITEESDSQLRFRNYQPPGGLVTVLIQDTSLGIPRSKMAETILNLNSADKLTAFEAIGQFGHGGSSALAFCESCLIMTSPRFSDCDDKFFWTLIYPEQERNPSKQSIVRKWFCDEDELPFVGNLHELPPKLRSAFPGTSLWHFGFFRGPWLKSGAGPHQDTPAGRLGRLFFSYPLPFEIRGEFARGDSAEGTRTVTGAYYRLLDDRRSKNKVVEYRTGEKSDALRVEGVNYGQFSVFVFVLHFPTSA